MLVWCINLSLSMKLRDGLYDLWVMDLNHPFVVELYSGSLPLEKFKYYILQDYNYLVSMVKVLSLLAAKAPTLELARLALELAYGTVTGEMENYRRLLNMLNLTIDDAIKTKPNMTNVSYMSFLIATASLENFYSGLASILPCMWTYMDIAELHKDKLKDNKVEVYRVWALTYLSDDYRKLVYILRDAIDKSNLSLEQLHPFFERALRYEIMFWDSSYRMD